ncbi:MAG TPA: M4 family metallopeptidase [Saprospiraceae bacterium]|nr:M4 family metallopeptidase [Saprospiraceae bacterium]
MRLIYLFLLIVSFSINANAQLGKIPPGHAVKYPLTLNAELSKIIKPSAGTSRLAAKSTFSPRAISPILPSAGMITIRSVSANGLPQWVEGELVREELQSRGDVQSQSISFLEMNKSVFKLENPTRDFHLTSSIQSEDGSTHLKFDQYYKGIPVWNAEVALHYKNGKPYLFNGQYFPLTTDINITPVLTSEAATTIASLDSKLEVLSEDQLKLISGNQTQSSLAIYTAPELGENGILAYQVEVHPDVKSTYQYFIDASSGKILKKIKKSCQLYHGELYGEINSTIPEPTTLNYSPPVDGPAIGSGNDLNGVSRAVNSYQVGGNYYLINTTKNMFNPGQSSFPESPVGAIWTLDGGNTSPEKSNFTVSNIKSSNNTWSSVPGAVSAHYNANYAYDYFWNTFGRKSVDGVGGNVVSIINITEADGSGMDNAFWNGQAMFYGNGNKAFKPLAGALDVGGHEISHGVIQATANLTYEGESGALNESFADIFGVCIDRDDYRLGEDVVRPAYFPSGALRDMANPHNGGSSSQDNGWQPAHMNEKYTGTQDNGGVHINSGIVNFAFYKVSSQFGKNDAEKIYYNALSKYLTKSSKFVDCRNAVIQATKDFYSGNVAKVAIVENAYSQVGIGAGSGTTDPTDYDVNKGQDVVIYASGNQQSLLVKTLANNQVTVIDNTIGVLSKPSVTDDGSYAVFVGGDKRVYLAEFTWPNPQAQLYYVFDQNDPNKFRNAAISKDGNLIACILDQEEPVIYIIDLVNSQIKDFTLTNPTTGGGTQTADVKYPDALEFDLSSQYVMYDAFNKIGFLGTEYWDISFLRAWNPQSKTFGDGKIEKLFSSLPENTSVGNPVFSKNSSNIISLDYVPGDQPDTYLLIGADIERGNTGGIFQNSVINYPCYSKDDNAVIFNATDQNNNPVIGMQKLKSNKIEASTESAKILISNALLGNWFGTGSRNLDNKHSELLTDPLFIHPTLARNTLNLEWTSDLSAATVLRMYDMKGTLVQEFKENLIPGNNLIRLNITTFSAGQYILEAQKGNAVKSFKFIKQ